MKEGIHDEDDARIARVCYRVHEEIGRALWRVNINQDHIYDLHLLDDGQQCLWKRGCGQRWVLVFCSLRCKIRDEVYDFLTRFPIFRRIMDDIVV
jgi:hypothetical protein